VRCVHPFRVSSFIVDKLFRKADRSRAKLAQEPIGGVAGHAGEIRAIAPSKPPNLCLRQGRRRPTPRFRAEDAGGVTAVENASAPPRSNGQQLELAKAHYREGYVTTVPIKPVAFTLLRCKSAELFFSCKTPAPGGAAGGPRRGIVPQAPAA
jgi:hypothetical protein